MNRNQIIAGLSSVFLAPSLILTVTPAIERDIGLGVCVLLSVCALPFIPFALRRCQGYGVRALLAVFGAGLLLFNLSNAMDSLNRTHTAATSGARGRIVSATALNTRLADLADRRREIPPHAIVSKASADAAQLARDDECASGHGYRCRTREDALDRTQRDRAATERAALVETEIDAAKRELASLGAVEAHADATAAQLASFAGLFWTAAATSGDGISLNRPVFVALVVEFMAGAMPWILVTIFGKPAAPLPLPKPKAKPRKGDEPADKASVQDWHAERVIRRDGCKLRAGVFFADYEKWCEANSKASVSIQVFGSVMKKELGIRDERTSANRTFYFDAALKPRPKTPKAATPKFSVASRLRQLSVGDRGEDGDPQDDSGKPPHLLH